MKALITIILLSVGVMLTGFANKEAAEMDSVVVALKSGNANQLSRYFDNRIDIALPEKSDNYSRSQAEMILKDFFSNNGGVKNFELKHRGENNGANFVIGLLMTNNGRYRTTLFMKQKGEKQLLQEMRFQQE
ncbi:DUF4783 domain-containing protein [Flavihumibacter petaseus]|uniref:DUF4783 domain-containing protein n=1 Tax=Flavihumibacter petaseus NBRC 106054 TaxID=1220578 RepID=A0A0E9N5N2_9BACT|nr:DUF4783 domain-containing protein [Flavihumibacter petaseus]GAO45113.1 hypothetical protein FPE01S_04_03560 [Flavihumibacter petaseus NBRC 106054]